jgi:hydrogenase maturation protein HypF
VTTATRADQRRPPNASISRVRITITGVVQGVGFRPFVHRLATELGLSGFVGNDAQAVFAEAQGAPAHLTEFERRVRTDAPPMAFVVSVTSELIPVLRGPPRTGFDIVASRDGDGARTLVPPDVASCDSCLRELFDPHDRRYRHPFITCTDCGPRLTIIRDLPYDRPATTMASFPMCPACAREYGDPLDRRFHAQPVACSDCGPTLWFERDGSRIGAADDAITAAHRALADGEVVAVKGIGGYHLACRADDHAAVARLRERKARDQKPFALLARDLTTARQLVFVGDDEARVLLGRARPIVLLRRRPDAAVADNVAPGNPLLGVMLAYSPVHHLLLAPVPGSDVPAPTVLVMTSANVSDEPLCFDDVDAASRLPLLADAVLTHDRPIHVPCDDSVVRVLDGHELPIRRSRGYAPLPVAMGSPLPATLAVGGELKNTFCLTDGTNAFCSAHVGDMGSLDTLRAFERAVQQLTTLHRLSPDVIAADAHPAYLTRGWAERHAGQPGEAPLHLVQHHHAHVVSLLAEHALVGKPVLGVAFDGTGYGDDGTVWGGEFLLVGTDPRRYERVGHLRTVDLPGGDAAVRNPCRIALAYLTASGVDWDVGLPPVAACEPSELAAVAAQLRSSTTSVACSSMGRLFDAVAALLGVHQRIGYEAQAAIELEILAEAGIAAGEPPWAFGVGNGVLDYAPVVRGLVDGLRTGVATPTLAYWFHAAVAQAVAAVAMDVFATRTNQPVGLTGGVFQNVLLLRECNRRLSERGLDVLVHRVVPPNDGGLALGQAVIAAISHARTQGEEQ